MKRLIIVICIVAFLVAIPLSGSLLAKGGNAAPKVKLCHVIAANDVIPFVAKFGPVDIPGTLYFGKEISVAASAVDAHLAHGDSETYVAPDLAAVPIQTFKAAGWNLPATDCYYFVRD